MTREKNSTLKGKDTNKKYRKVHKIKKINENDKYINEKDKKTNGKNKDMRENGKISRDRTKKRKNIYDESQKKKKSFLKIIAIGAIIVIIAIVVLYFGKFGNNDPDWKIVNPENGEIKIETSSVDDGEIHYFKTEDDEQGFFILKNTKNQIVTRISLCEPCDGTSFHLDKAGKIIVCDECGTTWDTNEFKGISGGCTEDPPPPLEHSEVDGFIIIQANNIEV
jgi:uncharacterized membrane protein